MGKKTRSKRKKPPPPPADEPIEVAQAPHSFVIHRGLSCPYISDLTKDFRRVMEPHTAMKLKEKKSNKIKDFVSLSGYFHVSYMCVFNKATTQLSFKVVRMPRGPTLTFKVHQFTLARDVISFSKKQFVDEEIFHTAPLVIMNNFSGEGKHLKLMAHTFQSMFPAINIATVNLSTVRRCVLFSYDPIAKLIQFRHYSIVVVPVGLSKPVKKVVLRKIPNMSKCDDIADYFNGNASESEFEDDEESHVILPQNLKTKGNLENNKSAVRLYEIGPRITFELVKIEEGLFTGEVLYHETVIKSEQEIETIRKMREKKKKAKEHRKKIQEENVKRKEKEKNKKSNPDEKVKEVPPVEEVEPDDDAEYYRQEVGEEPDEEIFKQSENKGTKRVKLPKYMGGKKRKLNENSKSKNKDSWKSEKVNFNDKNKRRKDNKSKDKNRSAKSKKGPKGNSSQTDKKRRSGAKDGKFSKPIYKNKLTGKSKSGGKKKSRK
ncbi:protein Peter pan [Condylostylus longicornis]|uniref:protein Peter pan n=1 Tax=Condylostylus longicornis TaxID=2530218 RepID=UPI00244E0C7D|nr:protein Peter pan [Condylostylus longicornis]